MTDMKKTPKVGEAVAIRFSRGESQYDNKPIQFEVADFDAFEKAVLGDRSAEKGKTYICAPMVAGLHNEPDKYPDVATWRLKRLAQDRCFLPFDFDGFASVEIAHRALELLRRYRGFAYLTSSHTPEAPRCRVVLAQTRATDRAEGIALCKAIQTLIEEELGNDAVKFDTSVYRPEQPLFTPLHGADVLHLGGEPIDVDEVLAQPPAKNGVAVTAQGSKPDGSRLEKVKTDDHILNMLYELGMVRGDQGGGKFNIECPYSHEHSSETGNSSTVYYQKYTGGYKDARIHCLHGHCEKRKTNEFMVALLARYTQQTDKEADWGVPNAVNAPLEARHLTTDQANAVRLQCAAGGYIMHAAGRWFVWTGTHWCDDRAAAYRKTCDLSKLIDLEADDWKSRPTKSKEEKDKNDSIAKALAKWGKDSEMKQRLDAAFALLQTLVEVPAERLDSDPYALNVANGTVDLRSGVLHQHDKADLITHCITIAYDPKAEAPLFKQALAQITGGNQPLAEFLQRWFGYCANGVTTEQKFAVHHGDGANGKSLLLDTIGDVLGPYAGATAPGLLMAGGQNRHPAEIADLFGMRMATAHESGEGGALNEDRIKQATGSDKLKARYMRQDYFEFLPTHTFNLLTNHKPQIRGQDMGIWRRVMLVPYSVTFGTAAEVAQRLAQHVRDDRLGEALKAEAAGILVWVVRGAVIWYMIGLRPPDVVLAASAEYRSEQDRVGQFITERGEHCTVDWVPCDGLYKDYQVWCKDCGYFPLGKNNFIAAVEKRPGIEKQLRWVDWFGKNKQLRCFTGLKGVFKG